MSASEVRVYFEGPEGEGFGSVAIQCLNANPDGTKRVGVTIDEAIRALEGARVRVADVRLAAAASYLESHPRALDGLPDDPLTVHDHAAAAGVSAAELAAAAGRPAPRAEEAAEPDHEAVPV